MHGEGAVTDQMCQKWFARLRAGDFSPEGAPQLGTPVEVDRHRMHTLTENNQCSTRWEITDILKIIQINKVIGENEKCVFHFTGKKAYRLFGQPNISHH